MNKTVKTVIVAALLIVVGVVIAVKQRNGGQAGCPCNPTPMTQPTPTSAPASSTAPAKAPLPRLIEFGAGRCLMCRKMAPIIEAMKRDHAGLLTVEKVDVNEDRQRTQQFNIRIIPTQVFLDPNGKELFRHEGFFPREDITAKWKALGYDLTSPTDR